jgi:putative redox protein
MHAFQTGRPGVGLATMECTINWVPASGMAFVAETGSGHLLTMDGAPEGGGRNLAPRPMETLLAGAGACTAYDVVLILKRGRHEVSGCQLKVTSERASTDPKVFTKIHLHFIVSGRKLPATAVERAIALSHEKYCSATIMLGRTAEVTTGYEIVEA